MKTILFVGDHARSSGFGRASHGVLDLLKTSFNVVVLGINFRGDYDPNKPQYDYPVYPAWVPGGDGLGVRRMAEMVFLHKPDLIVLQCNPWSVPAYQKALHANGHGNIPVIAIVAIEGKNCIGTDLNQLKHAIFWNEFSRQEAIAGGFKRESDVIPLGVDTDFFFPGDKQAAREMLQIAEVPSDAFILLNVNRNQHRKRLDLTMFYFAEWIKTRGIRDAYLYMHVLPGSQVQVNLEQLGQYLKISDRLILAEPLDIFNGAPDVYVRAAYRAADAQLSTSLGEGHGLTTMEGMACGTPQVGGDYSAFGDWAKGAMWLVPCCSEGVMPDVNGMVGGVPDKDGVLMALDTFRNVPATRDEFRRLGLTRVNEDRFRWANIASEIARVITRQVAKASVK